MPFVIAVCSYPISFTIPLHDTHTHPQWYPCQVTKQVFTMPARKQERRVKVAWLGGDGVVSAVGSVSHFDVLETALCSRSTDIEISVLYVYAEKGDHLDVGGADAKVCVVVVLVVVVCVCWEGVML